jgi:2-hydroxycyclohexanecarboxyl-CoA dehydrogenase
MRGLGGKRAIVTGGGSGIGRATVLRLVEEGCTVGIFDVDQDAADATVALCGGKAQMWQTDIADRGSVERSAAAFERAIGPPELLANVAGWDRFINFLDTDTTFWDKIIGINLYGPLHMHHVVVRGMAERGFGRVVNVASDAGRVGSSGEAVYSACKGGIIAFTKTMARELARRNVTLNVLCPGPTDTPLFNSMSGDSSGGSRLGEALARAIPMRRLGKPEDYPGTIAFLLSDDAAYMTGQTVSVSGGLTLA